ncbi:hypothetical protein Golax_022159 [Gossypium laxum]|uniref:Reverse transcriptase zinc-binding domain-containing protein n=1 Tax=Gossypium laxum TaxID=34288 RepID=A0A7J9AQA8_9ROSI|nr:hypothetical protein [Gossypium laxum]
MRSAYKLLLDSNRDSQFRVLQNATKGFYRKLWNLSLTTKQKITTWKISWNFLPTLVNLYNRRIEVQLACPRCGRGPETINHVFRDCPNGLNGMCRKTCCVLWVTWNERNKSLHEGFKNFRRWAAEAVGKYIMKLDGLSSHYRSGSSVVVRDDREMLLSQNQHCMGVVSPFAVEALVCSQPVTLGRSMGVNMVEIEGDSLTDIKKMYIK